MSDRALLVVMDGFGLREEEYGNAIVQADTPTLDRLMDEYPTARLPAHGEHVGLLEGGLGGSEVGHMQLGAGRLVPQMPKLIHESIEDGSFFEKKALNDAIDHAKANDGTLHVMGLCSDKAIHAHIAHLFAVLELADRKGFDSVCIHCFLDGRDTEPKVAKKYVRQLQDKLDKLPGTIATVSGRYYAMDRDRRWDRTEQVYDAIVRGEGLEADSAIAAIEEAYQRDETDEFVQPTVVQDCPVKDGDAVFIFNFRADRCIQMTKTFQDEDFDEFDVEAFDDLFFASMTRYSNEFDNPVAFQKETVSDTLGEVLGGNDLQQYRIAESEKKAHVTYFFSGRREEPFRGESRKIFPSPKVDVYDKTPEMRAEAITEKAVDVMEDGSHEFVLVNLSNCDMVGHTGDFAATVEAVEFVDSCVDELVDAAEENDYTAVITADHGNADEMKDEDGDPLTAHSMNPVPLIVVDEDASFSDSAALYNVAPAVLEEILDVKPADVMDQPAFTL
ncbi:MAG: 2,3-bisphosphoglycerate-independent phosphoglycerate mutase [Candidatus Nanohaloarchaea archaeon]|nr:2,3-bisphosphoglycerate-independent phosphoglycerate mutase [Candidatus Nanohaloarchaea archaeon]